VRVFRSGGEILGEFDTVGSGTPDAGKGTHPWTVFAQWKSSRSGQIHDIQREDLPHDPGLRVGDIFEVYVDAEEPDRYIVDVWRRRGRSLTEG
jgi:hypothetical protein